MADDLPEISIIIPTYNERNNIAAVVRDVFWIARRQGYALEVIIVDDNSPDGTGREADRLAEHFPVRVVHREGKLGLGTAFVAGLSQARGRICGLMDGDRSHPAEVLPDLIEPIRQGKCQLAIASRYAPGGSVEYWPWHRRFLSLAATLLARAFAPAVRDPLSGFIFFERSVVEGLHLTVRGYKIGLEILIKGRYDSLIEVPYVFRSREVGHSKLGWAEYIDYLRSLAGHAWYLVRNRHERPRRTTARRKAQAVYDPKAAVGGRLWGPCPLCGADNSKALFVKDTYRYVRCRACGLIFVNPTPAGAELEAIYQDPRYFANRNEWTYGYNDYFGEKRFYEVLFERRVRECEAALGIAGGDGRRLLDVGCAAGFLLEVARRRGWQVAGVEISAPAAAFANDRLGGAVRIATLERAHFDSDSFDCVVMLDIVEHVSDPIGLLREASRILKPGGVLMLSAPNVRSLSARLAGRYWFHFKRDHVVLFSEDTLSRALEAADLQCIKVQRNGKMVSLNYLFARLKTYVPWLGRLLLATVGRFSFCDRLFYDSWTGELLALVRKPGGKATTGPVIDETYSRFRSLWWPPTALWRTAEYFRLRELQPQLPVLDLGCGDGYFARQLIPRALHNGLIGLDRRLGVLRSRSDRAGDRRVVCADAQALPFRSNAFGFVLANCSLEHIEDIGRAVGEIARILRPGARLVFTVPSESFGEMLFFSGLLRRARMATLARAYGRLVNRLLGHRSLLSRTQWQEFLERAGLKIERTEHFMPPELARRWDLSLWLGAPGLVSAKLPRRTAPCARRARRLPEPVRDSLLRPCKDGAGIVYCCVKPPSGGR